MSLHEQGRGMANRIATQVPNSQLLVWNRNADVSASFAGQYEKSKVAVARTPADVVKECDVTYSLLSTMEASHAVVFLF